MYLHNRAAFREGKERRRVAALGARHRQGHGAHQKDHAVHQKNINNEC